jgi:hypothetical protein
MNNEFDQVHLQAAGHQANTFTGVLNAALNNPKVKVATAHAAAAGVPFWQILSVIMPMVLDVLRGKPLDMAAILAAIEALIPQPAPVPPAS